MGRARQESMLTARLRAGTELLTSMAAEVEVEEEGGLVEPRPPPGLVAVSCVSP